MIFFNIRLIFKFIFNTLYKKTFLMLKQKVYITKCFYINFGADVD